MTEKLLQLQAQVCNCTYSDAKSFSKLQDLIHQIALEIQQHYKSKDNTLVLYDVLLHLKGAEKHLQVFQPATLDTDGGVFYYRALENAKADTLYVFVLLQSAIHFGHVLALNNQY